MNAADEADLKRQRKAFKHWAVAQARAEAYEAEAEYLRDIEDQEWLAEGGLKVLFAQWIANERERLLLAYRMSNALGVLVQNEDLGTNQRRQLISQFLVASSYCDRVAIPAMKALIGLFVHTRVHSGHQLPGIDFEYAEVAGLLAELQFMSDALNDYAVRQSAIKEGTQ